MVKLIGPLCSVEARGALGKTLTYARLGMTSYAKAYAIPFNPNSTAQQIQRFAIRTITQAWASLTQAQRDTWLPLADHLELSPYHAFLKHNAHRWNEDLPLTPNPTYNPDHTNNGQHFNAMWEGDRYALDAWIEAPTIEPWALQITAFPTTPFTPSKANTILIPFPWTFDDPDYTIETTWTPPTAPPWYFQARYVTIFGAVSTWFSN